MKEKRKTPFPLRASDDVMAWLKLKAERSQRSVNFVACRALEEAKQREEREAA
ncbi:hypothetical protein [Marinobacterium stanieri]|uniref:hypothetical protein n=1 Tax=Marinobacterium stanieri TaxID=49186 RepID=UPI001302FD1B|nr:hypothetical protein [Marinobacterium stanieri]